MASPPPLSSLRLLLPPLRLLTAAMWQVARRQSVSHYGMLEDFVSLVTEAVPQLLTDRQKSLLLLALRAKVTLCDPQTQHYVYKTTSDHQVDELCSSLVTQSPEDRLRLLQEVFHHDFDSALQCLISDFLSRIDQLFPVPDFKQAACWLDAAPGGLEDCLQEADCDELRELLTNQSCRLGHATTTVGDDTEKLLLSAWTHPLLAKPTSPEPPLSEVQSDPPPDVERVKVEVEVMTEDEEDEQEVEEETVSGPVEQEAPNQSSAVGSDECAVTPVIVEDRLDDSPGDFVDQSEQGCSEVTANALYSISHNSQRVAHKCPQCGKCFIYRSQYAVFLSLVFMTELVAGISGFVFRHEIKETFLTTYSEAVMRYDGRDDRSLAVDGVQRRLLCCGVHNYTSWLSSLYFPVGGIPSSCCVTFSDCSAADLKDATMAARKVHKQGCYELVTSVIEGNLGIIAGVTFGVAFSQLIGVSLACCLSRFINANQYEMV